MNAAPLLGALTILPEYLRSAAAEEGAVIDYRDWQIPLGRRFRSLKLWFTIRAGGVADAQAMVHQSNAVLNFAKAGRERAEAEAVPFREHADAETAMFSAHAKAQNDRVKAQQRPMPAKGD